MTPDEARRLALGAVVGSVALAGISHVARTGTPPRIRLVIGGFIAAAGLLTFAGVLPGIVGALAVVLLVSTMFDAGAAALPKLTALVRG